MSKLAVVTRGSFGKGLDLLPAGGRDAALSLSHGGRTVASPGAALDVAAQRSVRKFLRTFPGGFYDKTYLDWERGYKWQAHREWNQRLNSNEFTRLIEGKRYSEVAEYALRVESRRSLLFSFEKMALRDALRSAQGARTFAIGLHALLCGDGALESRFDQWCSAVAALPRRQTRVLTWPVVTVFGFMAQPGAHIFLKPITTRRAAKKYGYELNYMSAPSWATYSSYLAFAQKVRADLREFKPRDMIDIQSFLWVLGSDEYAY